MINSLMGLLISKGILGLGAYDVEECHLDEVEMYAWPDTRSRWCCGGG